MMSVWKVLKERSLNIMALNQILKEVVQIKGVSSVAVVDSQGGVIESVSDLGHDFSTISSLVIEGIHSSRKLAGMLEEGELQQTVLEYEQGPVVLSPLKNRNAIDSSLQDSPIAVVVLDSSNSLGRARLKLGKLLPQIAEMVNN